MNSKRLLSAVLVIAGLAGCATAKEQYLNDGYRLLTAEEIAQLHQDVTHEVELASGKSAVAFFTADGLSTFKRSDGVADQGNWETRDQSICYVYPSTPATSLNCFSVAVKNDDYVLFKEFLEKKGAFGARVISITPGNSHDLPID